MLLAFVAVVLGLAIYLALIQLWIVVERRWDWRRSRFGFVAVIYAWLAMFVSVGVLVLLFA